MVRAVPHVIRHRLDDTKLQVIADSEAGLEAFAAIEKSVMRSFRRHGGWPHKQVNLFVFETLRPLVDRIRAASSAAHAKAQAEARAEAGRHIEELDRKPMVHVYNLADPAECSIFVNRRQMIRLGLWDDKLALEALLAHEHAHPLAENPTTRAARGLKASIGVKALPAGLGAGQDKQLCQSLERIVDELCLHAPHEVFANELAVRAGFGEALFHLDRISLIAGRAGLAERAALEAKLRAEAKAGRLSEAGVALTLLMASMEAHIRMALESAAFARAGETARVLALDALLEKEVFQHVEPEIGALYRDFFSRYAALKPDLEREAVRAWMTASCTPLLDVLGKGGVSFTVDIHG
jgi:hypothetical protein